jgi:hypothetical protein
VFQFKFGQVYSVYQLANESRDEGLGEDWVRKGIEQEGNKAGGE